MGLLDDIKAAEGPKEWPCKMCRYLALMDPKQAAEVQASQIPHQTLATILTKHDMPISGHSVRKHRVDGHGIPER